MSGLDQAGEQVLRATLFMRHPRPGFYSIETVFRTVAAAFPAWVQADVVPSPFASRGVLSRLRSVLAARRAMRRSRADIAHVVGDEHFLVLGLPRKRTVLTVHDCDFLDGKPPLRRWLLWLFWIYLPVRAAAVVTTISERTRAELLALTDCAPDHVRVIENPLPAQFRPEPVRDRPRPRVLHIGTKPNKNLGRLVEALKGVDADLTIVGRLSDEQRAQVDALGGSVLNLVDIADDALADAYREATMLAFVSTSEGFGMPIIEAQAVGRPVLTSDRRPMSDVAGGAALLVDPEDTVAIRDGIKRLLGDRALREALVAGGHANVSRFDPALIAGRYAEIYAELKAGKR